MPTQVPSFLQGDPRKPAVLDLQNLPASLINSEEYTPDPSKAWPGMPPNMGEMVTEQIHTVSGYVGTFNKVLPNEDEATRTNAQNAQKMETACDIWECVEARQRAIALLPWHLESDDPADPKQRELCAQLTKVIERGHDQTEMRRNVQDAIWYGRSLVQIKYGVEQFGKRWLKYAKYWQPRHPDKLVFRYDDGTRQWEDGQVGIRVSAAHRDQYPDRVDPTQYGHVRFLKEYERNTCIIHKHMIGDSPFSDPYGMGRIHGFGIRDRIYWTWFQQQCALVWLMSFLERTALGIELWYYPSGNPEAESAMRTAATERVNAGGGRTIMLIPVIPGEDSQNYTMQHIEPGLGGAELIKDICGNFFGHKIKRYILGQTMTSEVDSAGIGSEGVAAAHMMTFSDIVQYDARKHQETLTRDYVRHLQLMNWPEMGGIYVRWICDVGAPESEKILGGFQAAWQMGTGIPVAAVYKAMNISKPDKDDELLINPQIQMAQMQMQQAQQQAQQQAAMMQQQAAVGGQPGQPGGVGPGGVPGQSPNQGMVSDVSNTDQGQPQAGGDQGAGGAAQLPPQLQEAAGGEVATGRGGPEPAPTAALSRVRYADGPVFTKCPCPGGPEGGKCACWSFGEGRLSAVVDQAKAVDQSTPIGYLGTIGGFQAYAVDFDQVKTGKTMDAVEGGNFMVYPKFVPAGQIWVDSNIAAHDRPFILAHEAIETRLMHDHGWKYDHAHTVANRVELAMRLRAAYEDQPEEPEVEQAGNMGRTVFLQHLEDKLGVKPVNVAVALPLIWAMTASAQKAQGEQAEPVQDLKGELLAEFNRQSFEKVLAETLGVDQFRALGLDSAEVECYAKKFSKGQAMLWGAEQEEQHPREKAGTVGPHHGGEFAKKEEVAPVVEKPVVESQPEAKPESDGAEITDEQRKAYQSYVEWVSQTKGITPRPIEDWVERKYGVKLRNPESKVEPAPEATPDVASAKPDVAEPSESPASGDRSEDIERILKQTRKPVPQIIESARLKGDDGNWYTAHGFPRGVSSTGERKVVGYVYLDKNGTTFGSQFETPEAAREQWEANRDKEQQEFREYLESADDDKFKSQVEYWNGEADKNARLNAPIERKPAKQAKESKQLTGDAADKKQLRELKSKQFKSHADEIKIERLERRLKVNPDKWSDGQGVGYYAGVASKGKPGSQINRGFRIVDVDPKSKSVLLRQVSDTGLTTSGGDNDRIGDEWVDMDLLVRDKKHDDKSRYFAEEEDEPDRYAVVFDPSKHPRGKPQNRGEFAEKGAAPIGPAPMKPVAQPAHQVHADDTTGKASMTRGEFEDMAQRFWNANLKDYFDPDDPDDPKNWREWIANQDADHTAMELGSDSEMYHRFLERLEANEDFNLTDLVQAYKDGGLSSGPAQKAAGTPAVQTAEIPFKQGKGIGEPKPPKVLKGKRLASVWQMAQTRPTKATAAQVQKARKEILIQAHIQKLDEALGVPKAKINSALRSWSAYPSGARELDSRLNQGVPEVSQWTGIPNMAFLNRSSVSADDVDKFVKSLEAPEESWRNPTAERLRQYIARTMLAVDTRIDYSDLSFKSVAVIDGKSDNTRGVYRSTNRSIEIKENSSNTVAHEIGHYLDNKWGTELLGRDTMFASDASVNMAMVAKSPERAQWFNRFKEFVHDLGDRADIGSGYTQNPHEVFARFFDKFVQWTEQQAGGRAWREDNYRNDRFHSGDYTRFVKLLQEKAYVDAKDGNPHGKTKPSGEGPDVEGQPARHKKDGTPERYTMSSAEIDDACQGWQPPTEGQIDAGNYSKPRINLYGIEVAIENPAGTKRRPEWPELAHHYGYCSRVCGEAAPEARDGDKVDIFLGPHPESELVYVVDQEHPSGRYDEPKVMMGFINEQGARDGYLANYTDGWHVGPITGLTVKQFKSWLENGDTTRRIADQVSRYSLSADEALEQYQAGSLSAEQYEQAAFVASCA